MSDAFVGVHWAAWQLIYLLPLLAIFIGTAFFYVFRAQRLLAAWQGGAGRRPLVAHVAVSRLIARACFLAVAVTLIFVALMRPQWGVDQTTVTGSGRAVLVALDVSRSMCAQDVAPSRIGRAKKKIKDLIRLLKAERLGLLVFSGEGLVLCPMTTDYDAFTMFLDNVAVEAVSSGTTSIGAALEKVLVAFDGRQRKGTRLVVLFTDGEDFSGRIPELLEKVRSSGTRICIVQVGTDKGGPIPTYDQQGTQTGFLKDRDGHVVVSRPDVAMMKELAEQSGGLSVCSCDGDDDVLRVKRWIERFERSKFGERQMERHREQFFWYTGVAFLLLLLGCLL
ncbi:MAG: VWA domain-containing protein [Candidatus Dependentiae bacterium]|nr:VWA domain-containing protein [Candidatus Dependentiae bacterium]